MQITLSQFEQIDRLRNRARRDASARSHISGQPIRPLLNEAQHEARLYDAIIGIIGYDNAVNVADLAHYADSLITDCLIGKVDVVDAECVA